MCTRRILLIFRQLFEKFGLVCKRQWKAKFYLAFLNYFEPCIKMNLLFTNRYAFNRMALSPSRYFEKSTKLFYDYPRTRTHK